ncbi:hypothetical protein [Rhodoferax sp. U11-2br]|uniref:hypothetical protein n=1 Tax=Rhodoferax sp. U11-2br TaxID=2838878 RepID=UPI001BE661C0|nr:hypothetical protein [Rhodoferax sp. U11-2br]MBT3067874.1 hypothetical protein [Rhodoferax sp. U11-2br]
MRPYSSRAENPAPLSAASAMVIDDNALTQELSAEILEIRGIKERLSAKDGRLAALKYRPNVMICHIFML